MRLPLLIVLTLGLGVGARAAAPAVDWTGFRGGDRGGVSTEKGVPVSWSDSQNVKWKTVLPGPGASSPVVTGDRLFVTCYTGYGADPSAGPESLQRHLFCLDRKDGHVLWSKAVAATQPDDPYRGYLTEHGYATSTPVTDGERVYVFFGKSGVLAFDMNGKQIWKVDVGRSSGNRQWGSASSLLLYKDLVIVNASEESRCLYALDRKTGQEVWKVASAKLELAYGTPALVSLAQGRQELVIAVPGEVWGFDPDTGKNTWYAGIAMGGNICPSVTAGPGVVYVTGGFPTGGCAAIRAGGSGNVTGTHVLWTASTTSYVPTPVYFGEHLYWVNEQGFAHCVDARTSALVYRERLQTEGDAARPRVYASTLVIDDKLYTVSRNLGTFVLAAAPKFAQLHENLFAGDSSVFNATPAVSQGQLFLRSNRFVYCLAASTGK